MQSGEGWETVEKRFQREMNQGGAGLNDPRHVMREANEHIEALHDATTEWRNALVAAGLPARVWESNAAYFRLISSSLPGISLGAFVTRLDYFVGHQGPAWLAGSQNDLRAFHEEVIALDTIARPLRSAVHQVHKPTLGNRSEPPLSRALSHPRASAALDEIVRILGHLSTLAPLLKPLPQEPWDALSAPVPAALDRESDGPPTMPLSPTPNQPLTRLRVALASFVGGIINGERLSALRGKAAKPLGSLASRWRQVGSRRLVAMAGILLVLATITAALTLARQPHDSATTSPAAATAGASPNPRGTPTATPRSTAPAASATPQPTTPPAPTMTLACVVRGLAATLTITNSGTTALTWQAKPQGSLNVSPTRGTLAGGQSTTARVTADHRKTPTGSITVTASSSDGVSTSSSVECK